MINMGVRGAFQSYKCETYGEKELNPTFDTLCTKHLLCFYDFFYIIQSQTIFTFPQGKL